MRKIFSYLVTLITLLCATVFCVPTVINDIKFSMEYTGGFETLYKVTSKTEGISDSQVANALGDGMEKMLAINNAKDSIITIENGNYIRANITSQNQLQTDNVKNAIQNSDSYEITFRNVKDEILATGDEILKDVGAEFTGQMTQSNQQIIYLHIKDTEKLGEITESIANSEGDKNLIIWIGFKDGVDGYDKIGKDTSVDQKVIYNATVSEKLEDEIISVTGNYTEDVAKNTVNLINSGTYKYDLNIVQQKTVLTKTAIRNRNLILIGLGIVSLIIVLSMAISFKLEGLFSIPTLIFNEFFMIFTFNKLQGVINPLVIGAFILTNVVMFTLYFLVLNKYNKTLKINKSPIKAYRESFKKNTPIILDTTIAMIIFAIITYFFGHGAENFSIYLAVGATITLISLLLIERFTMYLTCDCLNKNNKTVVMSSSEIQQAIKVEKATNKDIDNFAKPIGIGFTALVTVALIICLICTFVIKAPFGFYGDANKSSSLEIITTENKLETESQVMQFFDKNDMRIELTSIELFKDNDNKYHIYLETKDTFSKYEEVLNKYLKLTFDENTPAIENYIYYINDYNPESVLINFSTIMLTSSIALLVVAVYFAIRFKYSFSLAAIVSNLMTTISLISFFAITRIPINSQTVAAIEIVSALSIMTLVPFFSKIKGLSKEIKKPYLSYQDRVNAFKNGRDLILLPTTITVGLFSLISLVLMFFDLGNFSTYIALIIGSLFALIYNMIIVPSIWLLFEDHRDKKRRIFKPKHFTSKKYRPVDEQMFIGIND